jgi:serine/threonine protein kinase/Tol biopolymer transport system component
MVIPAVEEERCNVTGERWQEVRTVLEAALRLDSAGQRAYLDQLCASDPSLRREVESLLAADKEVQSGFLQSPLLAVRLEQGTRIGDYEIQSLLGAGGMGEVYRARDLRLRREVAVKVLPAVVSSDPERLRRFEQEAMAAAALNHPNILAVHQLGTYAGTPYLVSELLEGETLREQIRRSRIAPRRVLDYGVQIAHGLSAAHEKGIVHRDLKPENLFVTKDGRAKILDFGLAKLTQAQPGSEHSAPTMGSETEPGLVMGTVGYMSPEQVRGQPADHRADIFAFGAILYEMLTGKRAFHEPTSPETMSAILNEDPPEISQVTPNLPLSLQRVVHRCLEKNPERRFQSTTDLAFALEALSDSGAARGEGLGSRLIIAAHSSLSLRARQYAVWTAGLALLAIGFAAYKFWPRSNVPNGPAKVKQISQWNKPIRYARLSPDGHAVAFVSPIGGVEEVFLMLTSGGEPLQLTKDEADKFVEGFSSDGKEIYYRRSFGRDEIWAVPTLGGNPRRVISASYIVPSPDGSALYYVKSDRSEIFRADRSGLNEEAVYHPEETNLDFLPLVVFPGNNDLLAVSRQGSSTNFRFHRINLTSHKGIDLGEVSGGEVSWLSWDAFDVVWGEKGKTVLFSRTVDGLTNIWNYDLQQRSLMQVTFGAGLDFSPMPEPGGSGTYFVNGKSTGYLTAYDLHSKKAIDIASENSTQPIISPDGKRVMYITILAHDRNELWVSNIDGTAKVKIATGRALWTGNWSADGSHLTFCETEADSSAKNYVVAADGSGLHQLPSLGNGPMNTVWSPDQKSLYVSGTEKVSSIATVWKVGLDGSNVEKFMGNCGAVTDIDPGGKYLLAMVFGGEKMGVYEISLSDRKCAFLSPATTFGARFARDGKSLVYDIASRSEVTIYRQSWKGGRLIGQPLVALRVPFAYAQSYDTNASDFSLDLSTIVYARPGGNADLYLLGQK